MSAKRDPGEAADKRRHGERQAQNHAPNPSPWQIAAFQQPGQRQADHAANDGYADHQCERIAQQAKHIGSPQQVQCLRPACLPGFQADIQQRQQAEHDQQQNGQYQPDRRPLAPRYVPGVCGQ
ncbi:hypothetical protein D3C76_1587780 [compost metagenome]